MENYVDDNDKEMSTNRNENENQNNSDNFDKGGMNDNTNNDNDDDGAPSTDTSESNKVPMESEINQDIDINDDILNMPGNDLEAEDEFNIVENGEQQQERRQSNISRFPLRESVSVLDGDEDDDDEDNGYLPGVDDLPLFATKEAKKLDALNKESELRIEAISEEMRDMYERIKVMKDHFKNVQQEVEHTNALYVSKQAEIGTENHLTQLSIRALARCQHDTKKSENDLDILQNQLNTAQNEIYKANEKLDAFKFKMKWNQEELEKWALAAKQKEEDSMALERYSRADEQKIKELLLQQEQLTREMQGVLHRLEAEFTDTQAKQMELDRVAIEFRDTHAERQTLLARWQDTIEEMKRRDFSINELGERFATAKTSRAQKEQRLNIQLKRLEAQVKENKQVEAKSEVLSRIVSQRREEMILGAQKLKEFKDELESIKNELTATSERLVLKRAENNHKNQDLEEKRIQLERQRVKYQQTKVKLEEAKSAVMKTELTLKQVEDELAENEKELDSRLTRVKVLKDTQFREAQALYEIKMEESRIKNEVDGIHLTCRSMDVHLTNLDKDTARQQELLYNAEFQIQQSERKVAHALGVRSDSEKREMKAQIEELDAKLTKVKDNKKLLATQARKLQNELTSSRGHKEEVVQKRTALTEKIGEVELENRMIEEEIRRGTKTKEEITVLNDLLRLDVRRLRDLLSSKADVVFSLENRRQQLMLSMEERKQEIAVHRDLLLAELRAKKEEKHAVILDLRQRELAVEKLKSRFEAITNAKGNGGLDEGVSQSYFIIQAAQRREELARKGDELDADIRKAEKEIRALQATLDHLNVRNTAFRTSFQKVSLEGSEFEILKQLEERNKMSKDSLFRKKKELQRIATDYDEDTSRLSLLRGKAERADKQKEHLEGAKSQVEEELMTQQVQLDELGEKIQKVIDKHRNKLSDIQMDLGEDDGYMITIEEKAVKAEVYRDVVQNVLYTLSQLVAEFPEVSDLFNQRVREADLKVPTRLAGTADLSSPISTSGGGAGGAGMRGKASAAGSAGGVVGGGGYRKNTVALHMSSLELRM